jgi:hypothetical protein
MQSKHGPEVNSHLIIYKYKFRYLIILDIIPSFGKKLILCITGLSISNKLMLLQAVSEIYLISFFT